MRLNYEELYRVWFTALCVLTCAVDAITNTQFNDNIREYSVKEDNNNATHLEIKTLQKEGAGRHSSFGPANSVSIKEIPDNALSASSHSRGLLHHDHGYVISEYEESFPYGHGHEYSFHTPDYHQSHVIPPQYDHYDSGHHHYSSSHHLDHGHDYKHYKHALAAKHLLWPVAGLALLGAAAALVTNPVLLQLGVVSGKRKKRDTDFDTEPDLINPYAKSAKNADNKSTPVDADNSKIDYKQRMLRWKLFKDKHNKRTARSNISIRTVKDDNYYGDDDRYIPVPLQIRRT